MDERIISKPGRWGKIQIDHDANVGQKFGRLLITGVLRFSRYVKYKCLCDCGKETEQYSQGILKGIVASCGCLHAEKIKEPREVPRPDIRTGSATSAVAIVLSYYRRNAGFRGYPFELTREQFYELIIQDCHYCGSPPDKVTKHSHHKFSPPIVHNGIDRRDNSQGYTTENSVPCCSICNKAKGALTESDFIKWVENLIKFRTQKKIG